MTIVLTKLMFEVTIKSVLSLLDTTCRIKGIVSFVISQFYKKIMIVHIVLFSAMDDIPKADEIRTLVKDIWDLRTAKLRSSIDTFVKSDASHAKVLEN